MRFEKGHFKRVSIRENNNLIARLRAKRVRSLLHKGNIVAEDYDWGDDAHAERNARRIRRELMGLPNLPEYLNFYSSDLPRRIL